MANSNSNSSLGFVSLLLFTVVVSLYAVSLNDAVSTICPKTRNPPFCTDVLKSAGATDLTGLVTYTLNLAHTRAGESLLLARSLVAKTADPPLKERYASCSDNYDNAVADIEQANKYLAAGDYNGVNAEATGVMAEAEDCQGDFKQPPADPSALPQNAKTLEDICSIILVISTLLPGPI